MSIPVAAHEERKRGMRLGTVRQVTQEHPGFTEAAVRGLIHKANRNGLAPYIHRIGRRIMVDLDGFQDWIRGKQERPV